MVRPQGGACHSSHPVKATRAGGGPIYDVPGTRSYAATVPEECFASIQDAQEAGYRAP